MKILAVIPARSGSKRIPGKNIRLLGGIPLIEWTIKSIKDVSDICDILVSTDGQDIADIAVSLGALVPWLRPKKLATDISSSVDVAIHAIDWYEEKISLLDGILFLQPTTPFRNKKSIIKGLELFKNNPNSSIIGVSPVADHPYWTYKISDKLLDPYIKNIKREVRSQDLEPAYVINGSLYLISPKLLRLKKSFFIRESLPLIIESKNETLDLDDLDDWEMAENILKNRSIENTIK